MSHLMSILMLAMSLPLMLFAETGMPIRVWLMPTSARYGEQLSDAQLERAMTEFKRDWDYLLDLGEAEYDALLHDKPQMLFDLLGQTNVLQDIRTTFNDEARGTGVLEDGVWYPLKLRLSTWSWDCWQHQIEEAVISNRTPDLMEVGTTWVPYLVDKEMIVAVTDPIAANGYHHGLLKALSYHDQLWAYPRQIDIRVLFSNANKLGHFRDQPLWTGLHKVLTEDKPFAMPELDQNAFHTFAALAYASGVEIFRINDDKLVPADSDDLEKGFEFFETLGQAFSYLPANQPAGYWFAREQVAATVGGADFFLHLRNENADKAWQDWTQIHPLPPQDGLSRVWLGGGGMAIGKWYEEKCDTLTESTRRRRAIERVAEGFTRTAPLALHVACSADNALRTKQFADFGAPGKTYLGIIDDSSPSIRFVSYPPHPDLASYETQAKRRPLIEAISVAIRGNPRAAQRLHNSWTPVREVLMTHGDKIILGTMLLIFVVILVFIAIDIRGRRALQRENEALDPFIIAALSPYVVAVCRKNAARMPGRPASNEKVGYGTLLSLNEGTVLLTALHVLAEANFDACGMMVRALDGRFEVYIPADGASVTPHMTGSTDGVALVRSDKLRALHGFATTTSDAKSAKIYGLALRSKIPTVFHGKWSKKNQGRWRQRFDDVPLPKGGDSGMGLFGVVAHKENGQQLIQFGGVFLSKPNEDKTIIFHFAEAQDLVHKLKDPPEARSKPAG